jgi:protein-arginine kinase activator protein McsA
MNRMLSVKCKTIARGYKDFIKIKRSGTKGIYVALSSNISFTAIPIRNNNVLRSSTTPTL